MAKRVNVVGVIKTEKGLEVFAAQEDIIKILPVVKIYDNKSLAEAFIAGAAYAAPKVEPQI